MEVVVDFEDFFEIVDYQVFEVQFWGDVQEYGYVQCVVMGFEWFGCGVVGDGLQYWGFYFEEIVFVEEMVDVGDDLGMYVEGVVGFFVDYQVDVVLVVVLFGVGQVMVFVWQWMQ